MLLLVEVLSLAAHSQEILRLMGKNPGEYTITCITGNNADNAEVVGNGQHQLYLLQENAKLGNKKANLRPTWQNAARVALNRFHERDLAAFTMHSSTQCLYAD